MINDGRTIIPLMKKNGMRSATIEMWLKSLLGDCADIIKEDSMLQYYGRLMGTMVDWTSIKNPV